MLGKIHVLSLSFSLNFYHETINGWLCQSTQKNIKTCGDQNRLFKATRENGMNYFEAFYKSKGLEVKFITC